MQDYKKVVEALQHGTLRNCDECDFALKCHKRSKALNDATDAIEKLENALTDERKKCDYLVNENARLTTENKELQAQLPKRGQYIHGRESSREYIGDCLVFIDYEDWRCSVCGIVFKQWSIPKYNYCPNCGAKMEVQE